MITYIISVFLLTGLGGLIGLYFVDGDMLSALWLFVKLDNTALLLGGIGAICGFVLNHALSILRLANNGWKI